VIKYLALVGLDFHLILSYTVRKIKLKQLTMSLGENEDVCCHLATMHGVVMVCSFCSISFLHIQLVVCILLFRLGSFGCRTRQNEKISVTTLCVMVPSELHGRLSMQKNFLFITVKELVTICLLFN
jgi:hypothetical protein